MHMRQENTSMQVGPAPGARREVAFVRGAMMKKIMLVVWLLLPAVALAYHFGPGQKQMALDHANQLLREADRLAQLESWNQVALRYEEALQVLPKEHVETRQRVRLELAKAQMLSSQLPVAHRALSDLVDELKEEGDASSADLLNEARSAHANSQYYMTWLMRLEGQPEEVWRPEVDSAEQTYRLLAQQSAEQGDEVASVQIKEDLEATIKLARMELSELQGLPLPSQ
jgi:hypothetical protein